MQSVRELSVMICRVGMQKKEVKKIRIRESVPKKTQKATFLALDGVNLEVNRGERIGIIGANGAG